MFNNLILKNFFFFLRVCIKKNKSSKKPTRCIIIVKIEQYKKKSPCGAVVEV